jgi:hypothetical protein
MDLFDVEVEFFQDGFSDFGDLLLGVFVETLEFDKQDVVLLVEVVGRMVGFETFFEYVHEVGDVLLKGGDFILLAIVIRGIVGIGFHGSWFYIEWFEVDRSGSEWIGVDRGGSGWIESSLTKISKDES